MKANKRSLLRGLLLLSLLLTLSLVVSLGKQRIMAANPISAEEFRENIFTFYGFTQNAASHIKETSKIIVKDFSNFSGGGGWSPGNRTVELNGLQHEAALHELSHVWWHNYRLTHLQLTKDLARDVVRLADLDSRQNTAFTNAIQFAQGYVYGIGDWRGMYCTDNGCADVHNITESDFDLTEAASNARVIDWEIYAGFCSWTMGKFKEGSHALPDFMWPYFTPQFTGSILAIPYYDGGGPTPSPIALPTPTPRSSLEPTPSPSPLPSLSPRPRLTPPPSPAGKIEPPETKALFLVFLVSAGGAILSALLLGVFLFRYFHEGNQ